MKPENPKLISMMQAESVFDPSIGRAVKVESEITLLDLFALAEIVAIGNNPKCRTWRSETRVKRAYQSAQKALKERERILKGDEK